MKNKSILLLSIFLGLSLSSCKIIIGNPSINNSSEYSSTNNSEIFSSEENELSGNSSEISSSLDNNSSEIVTSEEINNINFDIYNGEKLSEDSFLLDRMGYITNSSPIGELLSFTINYEIIRNEDESKQNENGFGYIKYRTSFSYIDNPNDYGVDITTLNNSYTVTFEDSEKPNFISFWTPCEVKINSLSFEHNDKEYMKKNEDFTIQVISTNDIHGQVKNKDGYPGLANLTKKFKDIASKEDQYNIFIDQGDLYQGTAEAGLSNGHNMSDFLIQNGFESSTLGNHEFDWGEDRIREWDEYLPIPFLANNIRYTSTNLSPSYVEPYKLVSRNGVKIGIIGSIGDVYSSISSSKVKGITFLTGSSLTAQIKKDSETLKELGADFIILSIHDGGYEETSGVSSLSYYDINSLSGTYVDLVLEAHTHQQYKFYDSKGVWHVQNGGNGSSISVSKLNCTFSESTNDYDVSISTDSSSVYQYYGSTLTSLGEDNVMREIDTWYDAYKYGVEQSEVVGQNVPYISSSSIKSKLAELYFQVGNQYATSSQKPVLGGGYMSTRTPYDIEEGEVKYGDIFNLLPFDNDIVLCSISGYYLKSRFINTSNTSYYTYYTIDPTQIYDSETYYIITDSYSSDYTYNKLTVVKNFTIEYNVGYARDLYADYLKTIYL